MQLARWLRWAGLGVAHYYRVLHSPDVVETPVEVVCLAEAELMILLVAELYLEMLRKEAEAAVELPAR